MSALKIDNIPNLIILSPQLVVALASLCQVINRLWGTFMGGDWGDEEDEGRKPHYPLPHAHAQITKNRQPLI
ncbi:hypothetical protein H6G27_13195 [Nostoc linckia FACHB-104]|nr:hypothetical protein [Nostoc linckia FACHB-104]